jgi:hypothetical protein
MVHARAFSFTDDSINVAFPSMTGMGRIPSESGPITGPQSANPAILLFQLRRAQSHWYQTLYESDPADPLPDPPSYIWQMCHDMREWAEALPDSLPVGIRELFDLELQYSYVYCIAPSGRAPHITAYGRTLIFEYVIAYMDRMAALAHGPTNPAFYTYHDALRVLFMGNHFISVLREAADALLATGSSSSSIPMPLVLPGQAPPPPIPARLGASGDNLDRSLRCLDQVGLTLQRYGERWEDATSLAMSWDVMSAEIVEQLRARRAMRDAAQQQQQQQQREQQQHHQLHQQLNHRPHPQAQPYQPPVHDEQHMAKLLQVAQQAASQQQQQQQQQQIAQQQHEMRFAQRQSPPSMIGAPIGGPPMGTMGPPPPPQLMQQQQQQQLPHSAMMQQGGTAPQGRAKPPQEVKWVDMDIQQMMRGGGI